MTPRLARLAEADLDDLWRSIAIASQSVETADHRFEQIWDAIDTLVAMPRLGHRRDDIPDDCLAWTVEDWTIVYRPLAGTIAISRILRSSRDLRMLTAADFPRT